jgi:FkbM family methyltransferase
MENFLKTIYFDYKIFKAVSLPRWIQITSSKYKCLVLILIGIKPVVLRMSNHKMNVSTIADLGTTISSLSDEYWDLYKVLNTEMKSIVDVGANIGQFTNAVKYWYPNSIVYSFEPDPDVYKVLLSNTISLRNVHTYNLALAESNGILKFYKSDFSGISSLIKSSDKQICIEVSADTADSVLGDLNDIDLLKIDVEGAELRVIRGAHNILKKSKYLLVEMSFDRNVDGGSNLDVLFEVRQVCPDAEILHTGRALSNGRKIAAQDFLIKLKP